MSTRREQRQQAQQFINELAGEAYPNSTRHYQVGSSDDIQLALRLIHQHDSLVAGTEANPLSEHSPPISAYEYPSLSAAPTSPITVDLA